MKCLSCGANGYPDSGGRIWWAMDLEAGNRLQQYRCHHTASAEGVATLDKARSAESAALTSIRAHLRASGQRGL